jgi:hypothetical protein
MDRRCCHYKTSALDYCRVLELSLCKYPTQAQEASDHELKPKGIDAQNTVEDDPNVSPRGLSFEIKVDDWSTAGLTLNGTPEITTLCACHCAHVPDFPALPDIGIHCVHMASV